MKIVIAPDSYKESLSAMAVAQAIEDGFRQVWPHAEYCKVPVADGGEGTVQSLVDATGGKLIYTAVTGPLGHPVEAFYGIMGDGTTAVIEMAAASGLQHVAEAQRNPLLTTSRGTGELILHALDGGAQQLIIGLGGSATNDAGAGMLQALGYALLDAQDQPIGPGGGALADLQRIEASQADTRLKTVSIKVACDVNNPLCGEHGAAAVFGPQKGADASMVAQLEANLRSYAQLLQQSFAIDIIDLPGGGAAGGMGATLHGVLGAELKSGIDIVLEAVQLADKLTGASLVITGEGRIDSQTIQGKTPYGVAQMAKQQGIAVIAIAGCLGADCVVVHQHGIDAVFAVVNKACSLSQALAEAADNVILTSRNVAASLQLGRLYHSQDNIIRIEK